MPVPADLASVAAIVLHEREMAARWAQVYLGTRGGAASPFQTYTTLSVPFSS